MSPALYPSLAGGVYDLLCGLYVSLVEDVLSCPPALSTLGLVNRVFPL